MTINYLLGILVNAVLGTVAFSMIAYIVKTEITSFKEHGVWFYVPFDDDEEDDIYTKREKLQEIEDLNRSQAFTLEDKRKAYFG